MTHTCPTCGKTGIHRMRMHFSRNPYCSQTYSSTNRPRIPSIINTSISLTPNSADEPPERPHAYSSRLRTRENNFNYAESSRKRACTSAEADSFPTPAEDLGDYITTFYREHDPGESPTTPSSTRPSPGYQHQQDILEQDTDSWNSHYANSSVAAVALPPENTHQTTSNNLPPTPSNHQLGTVTTITMEQQNGRIVATPQDRSMAAIYRLIDDAGSPRYLADAIVRQIQKEMVQNDFDPCHPGITLRDAFMQRASKSVGSRPPEAIPITLESGQMVTVYRFPFIQFYQEHLLSVPFSDLKNLSVDPVDPWGGYSSNGTALDDIHDGIWYQSSYQAFCEQTPNPEKYCYSPLLGYIDKTGTDGVMKNALEPWMWISTNLKQTKREDSSCWFPGGFVPNLTMISAAARRGQKGRTYTRSAAVRDYHRCLEVLLRPLKDLQRDSPGMYFRRGDQIMYKRIACPLAGVLGDNKSHDTLTSRMADYGRTTPRLCRRCLTEFARGADSLHVCHPVSARTIEYLTMGALGCTYGVRKLPNSVEEESPNGRYLRFASVPLSEQFDPWVEFLKTLPTNTVRKKYIRSRRIRQKLCDRILHQVYGNHVVDNAFFGLDFGRTRDGIFRATLTDILHTIQEGIVPKLLQVFYGLMGDKQRTEVDDLVQAFFCEGHNRSSERNSYPRVSFTRGYTQLTMLSADERVGQLFVLALLLQTKSGRAVLSPRFMLDFDIRRDRAKAQLSGLLDSEVSISDEETVPDQSNAEDETAEPEHDEEDTEQGTSRGLSEAQLTSALDNLDLSYVTNQIRPCLDGFHTKRLDNVLSEVLNQRSYRAVSQVAIQEHQLDYRIVPNLSEPEPLLGDSGAALPEMSMPEFEVEEERAENSIKLPMDKFVYLVETILSLHAFLKYGCSLLVSRPTGIADYKRVLELFLRVLVLSVDRGDNTNQWCLQKTLELVHFLEDMLHFGPASGFSTETGERGLKQWAKAPAKTAQKRSDAVFSKQVCSRIHERVLINAIANTQHGEENTVPEPASASIGVLARCANFVLELHQIATITRVLPSGKTHKMQIDFPDIIVNWFEKRYLVPEEDTTIQLYTEIVLPGPTGQTGTILRAHPNYQSDGPWYDYALASYDEDDREDSPTYPCKMACFFREPVTGKIMALVQEVEFQSPTETARESQLFRHWTLKSKDNRSDRRRDAVFEAIPVESLSDRIYALDPKPLGGFSRKDSCDFEILVVKYVKEQWPTSFLDSPNFFNSYNWDVSV
jgi:hypothetical protein